MKYFYLAVAVQQDRNETIFTPRETDEINPGFYAYLIKCTESDNLKSVLERVGGLLHANIFPTKKKAAATVKAWNASYKSNGTYLFDIPAF